MANKPKPNSILILSHFYQRATAGGGPPQDIRDYFLDKAGRIVYIEHPFPYAKDRRSSMTIYRNGALDRTIGLPAVKGPQGLIYIAHIFQTAWLLLLAGRRYDVCISLDNLNTVSVALYRWLGIIKKLIYYTIDYTPYRFASPILNNLYHLADRLACYWADAIWILSPRMSAERAIQGVDPKRSAPSILLPMGAHLDRIKLLPANQIKRHQLVFVGHLLEKQGVQLLLQALAEVIKIQPKAHLLIIGQGGYRPKLEQLTHSLKLDAYVTFAGFVAAHREVERLLCQSAIGLAPYQPGADNYTAYTDPGKPKLYLACGLPVIITDVPASAELIEQKKAGIRIEYTKDSIAEALKRLLIDDKLYADYRDHAINLGKQFNTPHLIAAALNNTYR